MSDSKIDAPVQCLAPTYSGEYYLKGAELRKQGLNRIGNMVVPNDNYCKFEDWIMPIFDALLKEQKEDAIQWTPSKVPCHVSLLDHCCGPLLQGTWKKSSRQD